jgi:thiamine-monophosphate kinase
MSGPGDPSGEDRLIAKYFAPLARDPRAQGLIDDAAVMTPPAGMDLVLKTDGIVGGVHFFNDEAPDAIARKALRVNLSDLAAKGATPSGYLITLALPDGITEQWLAGFARGLGEDAETYGCPLLGGDTVKTPGPVTISIAIIGLVPSGRMVTRMGAKPGDRIFVSGTIGDAALGLRLRRDAALPERWGLDAAMRAHLLARYQLPQPRNALADCIRDHARAAMDVSDGLVGDLAKLCRASHVSAEIDVKAVPLSGAATTAIAADESLLEPVLTGGDDYEILCTVAESRCADFRAAAGASHIPVSEIGRIVAGEGPPRLVGPRGTPITFARGSFSHF